MKEIYKLAKYNKLFVIEDASHAIGSNMKTEVLLGVVNIQI
jgi:dTDP-4-amino-4,6-dideoxygalactose transaminase